METPRTHYYTAVEFTKSQTRIAIWTTFPLEVIYLYINKIGVKKGVIFKIHLF